MLDQGVITRERMFDPLLKADPSFMPAWRAFTEEWRDEAELPHYLALADFARHLIGRLDRNETDGFEAIFEVVERWHIHGDAYVREAASVGLLEDLQNTNLHTARTDPSDFEPWLRHQSKRWWDKIKAFWAEGKLLTDD